jgi:hypothetical protein
MTARNLPSNVEVHAGASEATHVSLVGEGPFLLPFLDSDVSFGFAEDVAVMRMSTREGQQVLLPFSRETLRAMGLALAGTLKDAFRDESAGQHEAVAAGDLVFELRDEPR